MPSLVGSEMCIRDSLIFTPASNINGVAISAFDFRAIDNGGTTNGGIDTAGAATTITIDVSPVNDPPSGQNHTIQSIEDTPVLLDSTVFGFNDIDASDTLSAVIIDAIIGQGQLISQGQVVTAGQTISSTTINAGELYFEPEAHSFGEAHTMIEFRPVDSGDATGNLNIATTSSIITFNVAPVNDAPHNIGLPLHRLAKILRQPRLHNSEQKIRIQQIHTLLA